MERLTPLESDYYCVEDGQSDKEYDSDSSDDEVQKVMRDIAGVSRYSSKHNENSEFEEEMEKELTSAFECQKKGWIHKSQSGDKIDKKVVVPITQQDPSSSVPSTSKRAERGDSDSDDEYDVRLKAKTTDSDEEFCQLEGVSLRPDDENLFYDPKEDEDNQNWVDNHRQTYETDNKRAPNSDAVLNCPCCMGVLCYDCQRHDVYQTQYRAMFVLNCVVQNDYVLFQPRTDRRKQRKNKDANVKPGQKLTLAPEGCDPSDLFRPVLCAHCKTEVAVYDSEEIYHFFNVLASYT